MLNRCKERLHRPTVWGIWPEFVLICQAQKEPSAKDRRFLLGFSREMGIYPSATSRIIIRLKPTAKKTVPALECFP